MFDELAKQNWFVFRKQKLKITEEFQDYSFIQDEKSLETIYSELAKLWNQVTRVFLLLLLNLKIIWLSGRADRPKNLALFPRNIEIWIQYRAGSQRFLFEKCRGPFGGIFRRNWEVLANSLLHEVQIRRRCPDLPQKMALSVEVHSQLSRNRSISLSGFSWSFENRAKNTHFTTVGDLKMEKRKSRKSSVGKMAQE